MDGRDPGFIKEIIDEILVGGDLQALGRRLADNPASVWIDIESAFRHGTGKARRVVQHGDNHVAPLPECNVALFQKILWAIERSNRRRLTDRARIRGRRSVEHTSELQSLMSISFAVFSLK